MMRGFERGPLAAAEIRTPRLLLRCWNAADAPLLKDAIDSSLGELRAWMPWATAEPSPLDRIEERLDSYHEEFAAGLDWTYGIFDTAGERVLGGCGLHPRRGPGVLEIGYWLRTAVTGAGLASEATAALTRVAVERHGVACVEIRCDARNLRSAAVPRRLGFRHEKTLPNDLIATDGTTRDTMVWALFTSDYAASAAAAIARPVTWRDGAAEPRPPLTPTMEGP